MNFAPAGEVSIGSPGTTPAGYGGSQIRRELEMAGVKSSYVQGQTLESRRALEASALLPSHSASEAHVAHAAGS